MIAAADTWIWTFWAAVLVVSVALRGFYAGMETGIYVTNKIRLDLRAEGNWRSARLLRGMLDRPNNLLSVLLVGTNIPSYAATFAVSAMFVQAGYRQGAEWYTLAVATPLLFVFGESVPKNVFQRLAETLVYRLAWLLKVSSVILNGCGLAPVVQGLSSLLIRLARRGRERGGSGVSAMSSILAEGRASGVVTPLQSVMADRVINIAQVTLADVMVPISRAVTAPAGVTRDELAERIAARDHSRLPIRDEAGQVAGVVDVYDVLTAEEPVEVGQRMTAPLVLPESMIVTDALYRLQRSGEVMAIVAAGDGRHVGLATVKDLVEEIVGELEAW